MTMTDERGPGQGRRHDWRILAECQFADPEIFYSCDSEESNEAAMAVCASCLVRDECLAAVMAEEASQGESPGQNRKRRFGIRAGMMPSERWRAAYPGHAPDRRRKGAVNPAL